MTSYQIIDAPRKIAARDGLLQTFPATNPAVNWQGGIQFDPGSCGHGGVIPAECLDVDLPLKNIGCCGDVDKPVDSEFVIKARPYTLYSAFEVSTFNDRDTAKEKALNAFNMCHDKLLETEFWTGQAAKIAEDVPYNGEDFPQRLAKPYDPLEVYNPTFPTSPDPFDWTTSVVLSPTESLGMAIEAASAHCGTRAVIHVPASALVYWVKNGLVVRENNRWQTIVGGHIVVPGRGYPGTAPDGTLLDGVAWIYVTGMLETFLAAPNAKFTARDSQFLQHRLNRDIFLTESSAMVTFDPCVWAGIPMLLCDDGCATPPLVTDGINPGILYNEFFEEGSVSGVACG